MYGATTRSVRPELFENSSGFIRAWSTVSKGLPIELPTPQVFDDYHDFSNYAVETSRELLAELGLDPDNTKAPEIPFESLGLALGYAQRVLDRLISPELMKKYAGILIDRDVNTLGIEAHRPRFVQRTSYTHTLATAGEVTLLEFEAVAISDIPGADDSEAKPRRITPGVISALMGLIQGHTHTDGHRAYPGVSIADERRLPLMAGNSKPEDQQCSAAEYLTVLWLDELFGSEDWPEEQGTERGRLYAT